MAGTWEVVSNKKHRGDASKKNAQQKKKNTNNMPKLEENAPIEESETMFDAFIEKEKKRVLLETKPVNNVSTSTKKPKDGTTQPKKKNQDNKKKNSPPSKSSLEESVKDLNIEEMKDQYITAMARFPETPKFWLQDLASYMNLKLDVEIIDPCYSSHPPEYPVCLLSKDIQKLLRDAINKSPAATRQLFFETSLQSMVHDSIKGLNTVGYQIFMQLLLRDKPEIASQAITKCIDLRNSYQNRQNVCLSLFWVIGQAGCKNLEVGLQVWCDVMLPIIATKAYSKYIIDHLERLVNCHRSTKLEKCVLPVRNLFPLLDYVHTSSGLPGTCQKQLQSLYPTLKAFSFGPDPSSVLRTYFPSYLRRLEQNISPSMRTEVLTSLVQCLAIDQMSYSIWRQLYVKHLVQSSILIEHLHDEWDNLPSNFSKKLLMETISGFQLTNEHLKSQAHKEADSCIAACNAVLNKMNARSFPWLKVLLFTTVLVSSLLAYDIQKNGSFKRSKTGQLMKDTGLLAISEQAWGKITIYLTKASRWLGVNVPIFTKWFHDVCGPYVTVFWEKFFDLFTYLWSSTQGVRSWANTNIPPILKIVSDNLPGYLNAASKYVEGIIIQVSSYGFSLYKTLQYYSTEVVEWLHKNVLTGSLSAENLQKYAGNTVQAFQEYTMTTYNWISQYVATVVYPGPGK